VAREVFESVADATGLEHLRGAGILIPRHEGMMISRFTRLITAIQVVRDSCTHPYCLGCRV
jgi:hypothetical protein